MPEPKTLHEHLAAARAKVNLSEAGRKGGQNSWKNRPPRQPECTCGRTDDTHHHKCRAYRHWYRHREKEIGQ